MIIYIISFLLSCALLVISEKITNKAAKKIIEIIALLIPCILAAVRALSIGTDVEVYIEPLFNLATNAKDLEEYFNMKWFHLWQYKNVNDFEILFNILVYFTTKITNNINCILFVIHTIIIFPIYFGIKKYKELNGKYWICMMCFYLLFYNISLNLMRQFISISITFYGISCLINEKKGLIKYFISLFIAFLFHKSALLSLLIVMLYTILTNDSKNKKFLVIGKNKISIQKIIFIGIIVMTTIVVFNSSIIVKILSTLDLNYYAVYINGDVKFTITEIIKYLPILVMLFITNRSENPKYFNFLTIMFFMNILISYFSTVNIYAIRIGYIFHIFNIILYILIVESSKYKFNKIVYYIVLMLYLSFLWYYNFVIIGIGETVPYILGI